MSIDINLSHLNNLIKNKVSPITGASSAIDKSYSKLMSKAIKFIMASLIWTCCAFNSYANERTSQSVESLNKLFQEAIHQRAFPGGCVEADNAKQVLLNRCFGYFTYAEKTPDQDNSIFDLASL